MAVLFLFATSQMSRSKSFIAKLAIVDAVFNRILTARRVRAASDTLKYTGNLTELPTDEVPSTTLRQGDVVVVVAGERIPGDGEVIEGVASVDESAVTGESAPGDPRVRRRPSAVTGGTTVLSDRIVVRITSDPGQSFVDRMIALVEGSERQRTPNEIALNVLLTALTSSSCVVCATLRPVADYSGARQSVLVLRRAAGLPDPDHDRRAALGDRHRRHGPAGPPQRAGHVRPCRRGGRRHRRTAPRQDRHHHPRQPARHRAAARGRRRHDELAEAALLSSLADETPEGRSIVELAGRPPRPARALDPRRAGRRCEFSATTRMSGIDLPDRADPQGRRLGGREVGALDRCPGDQRGDRAARAARGGGQHDGRYAAGRGRAARRRQARCSASSTSRTSSSPACASGSTRCAPWASAP